MDASSSNQQSVCPPSKEKKDLKEPIKELVEVLEALLNIEFLQHPLNTTIEMSNKPMMMDIANLIIGYHQYTSEKEIASDKTIHEWLNIGPDEIPPPQTIFKQLQQPHIIVVLSAHGFASYMLPLMHIRIYHPSPEHIELTKPDTTCSIEGYMNVCYLYTTEEIFQARIAIKTEANMLSEVFSYKIKIRIGKKNSCSKLDTHAKPYQHPTNLSVMICNIMGAELSTLQKDMKKIVQTYEPKIIILTETRTNSIEAYNLASEIGYQQVITEDPINYNGGICMLSNLRNLSMKELMHTDKEITVDLLKI
ncbi:hypothetical protein COLO4_16721 [Corchorus olitorius]|uniref:Endonuclease/exonuclease/phosphatase n=1 Tax=Corchorus olitorius TaxID=93759 RepID=A0A1R3JFX5_9ROSI|nr:hypothetical protein COLO4_16721 [Corchorus olitorius]